MAVMGGNECVWYVNLGEGFVCDTSRVSGTVVRREGEEGGRGWELMLIPEYGRDGSK